MPLTPKEGITPKNPGDQSRNKFFIVIGKDSNNNIYGIVVINFGINPNLTQYVKDIHYPISDTKYKFLDHNSFVNCSKIKQVTSRRFGEMFNKGSFKGVMLDDDLELIKDTLRDAETIPLKTLKAFGLK